MGELAAEQLVRIVGVRFKRAGKIYYFDPGELQLVRGDRVLVETAAGIEFGEVVVPVKMVPESDVVPPIRPVLREVVREDYEQLLANRELERVAHAVALERIAARGLPMRLVNTEYTFDRNRLTFFFTADNRVDFRQLVRDLARQFGVRIELRQIGVRDEAKEVGGIGLCGRELCCSSWLGEFQPVSIRMAKEQRLSLNPSKLTGQCGRLKCCLKFENDTYRQIREELPEVGDQVQTVVTGEKLVGRVIEVLVARESVAVDFGEGRRAMVSLKQLESGEAIALTGKLAGGDDGDAGREMPLAAADETDAQSKGPTWGLAAGADDYGVGADEYAAALEEQAENAWEWDAAFADDDPAAAKVHSAEVSPEDVLTGGDVGSMVSEFTDALLGETDVDAAVHEAVGPTTPVPSREGEERAPGKGKSRRGRSERRTRWGAAQDRQSGGRGSSKRAAGKRKKAAEGKTTDTVAAADGAAQGAAAAQSDDADSQATRPASGGARRRRRRRPKRKSGAEQ